MKPANDQPNISKLKSNSVSIRQSFMGAYTNIVYRLGVISGLKRVPHFLKKNEENSEIVVMGETFNDFQKAKEKFVQLIWFTYRQKIKLTEGLTSDVGWGCLPRVGQMLLANTLVRFLESEGYPVNASLYKKIIQPFIDENQQQANYSLSLILKHARKRFDITPGQWFNINQVSEILRLLQDKNPIAGSHDLKLLFFNQSMIFVDEIYNRAKVPECKCAAKMRICPDCHSYLKVIIPVDAEENDMQSSEAQLLVLSTEYDNNEEKQIKKEEENLKSDNEDEGEPSQEQGRENSGEFVKKNKKQLSANVVDLKEKEQSEIPVNFIQYHKLTRSICLIVSVRMAQKQIYSSQFQCMKSLLQLPSSLGIVGGVPSKALYIVGHSNKQLIYLDPHFVQEHVDRANFDQHLKTFFCPELRTIDRQSLDPSMAFCFYLKSLEDIQALLDRLAEIQATLDQKGKSCFISVMEKDEIFEQSKEGSKKRQSDSKSASFDESMEFNLLSESF